MPKAFVHEPLPNILCLRLARRAETVDLWQARRAAARAQRRRRQAQRMAARAQVELQKAVDTRDLGEEGGREQSVRSQ